MVDHGIEFDQLVLCNLAQLAQTDRLKLQQTAERKGARLAFHFIFDREFVVSRLRRDGNWRQRLLGLSADPITLGRSPSSLVESPWASLPLVGREEELAQLGRFDSDLIVTGPPGVGKSRFLAEAPEALFVDPDASHGRLAEDIRWFRPKRLVIDDAGVSAELLRFLVRLRQVENDVAHYQLIAACWPDEVSAVRVSLPAADVMNLDLIQREDVDRIVRSVGVDASLARAEILDQAEGRPGWAVALADVLISSHDATSLLNGQALLGEVESFILRAGTGFDTVTLLTLVGALGGVREDELGTLKSELDVSRAQLTDRLRHAATSGLIDVSSAYDWSLGRNLRLYDVRPKMLARALVASQVFQTGVPAIDPLELAARWPGSVVALADMAAYSTLMGAENARAAASLLFQQAIDASDVSVESKVELCETYGMIDSSAGQDVLELVQPSLDEIYKADADDYWRADPLLNVVRLIANRHTSQESMTILLEAASKDNRPQNQYPNHPLRALEDLVHNFHPELPAPGANRDALASALTAWLAAEEASPARWSVFGEQVENLLSFSLSSAFSAPENPRSMQLIRTVVRAAEMRRIFDTIWPVIRSRLEHAPPEVSAKAVDAAIDWLRIGAGLDRPFGGSHPEDAIAAAAELGEMLTAELISIVSGRHGLIVKLKRAAEMLEFDVEIETPRANNAFFFDVERGGDWQDSIAHLETAIANSVQGWSLDDPTIALGTLAEIRRELSIAEVSWPDRIRIAFDAIARSLDNPAEWVEAALDAGLFPHAGPLLRASVENDDELPLETWRRCWADPTARWEAMSLALKRRVQIDVYELALEELEPGDYSLFETMTIRDELTPETIEDLLTRTSEAVRGAVAAAMFRRRERDGSWTLGPLEDDWAAAIVGLDFGETSRFSNWETKELFEWLAANRPRTLVDLIMTNLGPDDAEVRYHALPSDGWDALHKLPHEYKTELWVSLSDRSGLRMLTEHLVGEDSVWLETMLELGHLSIDDAIGAYSAFGPHPRMEELATILVPRGVDPERIAGLAVAGTWMGERSDRYSGLVEQFSEMANSADDSVAAVGAAGRDMFIRARDSALEEERLKRIRGQL